MGTRSTSAERPSKEAERRTDQVRTRETKRRSKFVNENGNREWRKGGKRNSVEYTISKGRRLTL